ncbi:MAG: MCE family protein [Bacteroidetes bacterium]|nr:MAG: MCE family protein [Bacteroidota bacterium]TAG88639.1 MAG: MCE family protein [Bacteroidota bacterium]
MKKEIKIALLTILSAVMLYTGFNFLKGTDFFTRTRAYLVEFKDLDGLTVSRPVMLNGLAVGRVANVEVRQNQKSGMFLLTLDVRNDLILTDVTTAFLGDNGLLGGKCVILEIKNGNKLVGGEMLKNGIKPGLITDLGGKASPLLSKVDSAMLQIKNLLETFNEMKGDLANTFKNLNEITTSFKNTLKSGQIDNILTNVNRSLQELQGKFTPILDKTNQLLTKANKLELEETLKKANGTIGQLSDILTSIKKGEGTLGALMKSDTLYQNINKTLLDLDKVFLDLRENPKKYVNISILGKKEKK